MAQFSSALNHLTIMNDEFLLFYSRKDGVENCFIRWSEPALSKQLIHIINGLLMRAYQSVDQYLRSIPVIYDLMIGLYLSAKSPFDMEKQSI